MTGLHSVTERLDAPPDLNSLASEEGSIVWLTEATSLVASGPFHRIETGTGAGRFEQASAQFKLLLEGSTVVDEVDEPGTGPLLFGSFTFDPDSDGSIVLVPSIVYGVGEGTAWRTTISLEPAGSATVAGDLPGTDATERDWMAAVEQARDTIGSTNLKKVVLARQVTVPAAGGQAAITARLRSSYPGCFIFSFANLVGASPELLLRRLGEVVDSIPLAGSAPRGATDADDLVLGKELIESGKNRSEHAMTVASVIDRLSPYCAELVAEAEPSLLLLENLQHLSTKVQGRLKGSADALQLAGALHPTAAVCGVPQQEALEFIRRAETFDRGRYAGPIGWMDRHGDGEWALALRCALIEGDQARVFAGAGIVADSVPEGELEETRLKLRAMLRALEAR